MKLVLLTLNDNFRNLKSGFELYFSANYSEDSFNPYCVVGRNGSGKSNILELLGAIFYNLELRCLNFIPAIYEELELENQLPNAYELEYTINDSHITIVKKASKAAMITQNGKPLQSQQELKEVLDDK